MTGHLLRIRNNVLCDINYLYRHVLVCNYDGWWGVRSLNSTNIHCFEGVGYGVWKVQVTFVVSINFDEIAFVRQSLIRTKHSIASTIGKTTLGTKTLFSFKSCPYCLLGCSNYGGNVSKYKNSGWTTLEDINVVCAPIYVRFSSADPEKSVNPLYDVLSQKLTPQSSIGK